MMMFRAHVYSHRTRRSETRLGGCTSIAMATILSLVCLGRPIHAEITSTGEVVPADPATWTSSTYAKVANDADGSLDITNDSDVLSRTLTIGSASGITGNVLVDGIGSTLANGSSVTVGYYGSGILDVSGGASWSSGYTGCIAQQAGSTGVVTINGTGSSWTNDGELTVGRFGDGTLNILNGATVALGDKLWIARYDGSTGVVHFDNGTLTTRGLYCSLDDLTGIGTIHTPSIAADMDLVFDAAHGLNQTILINKNPGQNISIDLEIDGAHDMVVGYKTAGSLEVAEGAAVPCVDGFIAYNEGSTGHASVHGAGSTWTISDDLAVGYYGDGGNLSVTNGGTVSSDGGYIARYSDSSGTATIDGTGSSWTNTNNLCVGYYGHGTLNISNGAEVTCDGASICSSSGTTGLVTVEGAGSSWTSSDDLSVGNSGNATMSVLDGASVSNSATAWIARNSTSIGTVTVDGAGSTWLTGGDLYVAEEGDGTLNINNGAVVDVTGETFVGADWASSGLIHFSDGMLETAMLWADDDQLAGTGAITTHGIIADADLVFDSPDDLTGQSFILDSQPDQHIVLTLDIDGQAPLGAGNSGTGSILIRDGMEIQASEGWIGRSEGSSGTVTVQGAGSKWMIDQSLYVGVDGSGALNLGQGAMVSNATAEIGNSGSSSSAVTVDGNDSVWSIDGSLTVSYFGSNSLDIRNGATVSNTTAYIGRQLGSHGEVTVSGPGSTWNNNGSLYAGRYGSCSLRIEQGGMINTTRGYIGYDNGPHDVCEVDVDGRDSSWTNDGTLYVGGNSLGKGTGVLRITNGAEVTNTSAYLGYYDNSWYGSSAGDVTVSGIGSTWSNTSSLVVGRDGTGTLTITDGGHVKVSQTLTIDDDNDNDSFINMSTGGKLSLMGEADDAIDSFLALIQGGGSVRCWDASASDWADIAGAVSGIDYTLAYHADGALAGYTTLTVGVVDVPASQYDLDIDGDVDVDDYTIFDDCSTGPAVPCRPECELADFDADSDVDQSDFGMLQRCFSGQGNDPLAACLDEPLE